MNKKSFVVINNEEVSLSPSTAVFSLSHRNYFNPLSEDLKKLFRVVCYTGPDRLKLLEVGLIKSGMLLTQTIVPKIRSFLELIRNTFEVFSPGFGEKKLYDFIQCVQEHFKDILSWKDGLKIAKELSTLTEIGERPESLKFDRTERMDMTEDILKHGNINKNKAS